MSDIRLTKEELSSMLAEAARMAVNGKREKKFVPRYAETTPDMAQRGFFTSHDIQHGFLGRTVLVLDKMAEAGWVRAEKMATPEYRTGVGNRGRTSSRTYVFAYHAQDVADRLMQMAADIEAAIGKEGDR